MTAVDYSVLENSAGSARSFYPQRHWTKTPESAVDYAVNVADGVQLSCRFHAVDRAYPTVLFFYGNGETAAGYDHIAPHYNEIGANFFVADYRGYGASGGAPTFNTMLADAHVALEGLREAMAELQCAGPVYVMGRSMGRHAAGELAVTESDKINGVIIESGRPNLGRFADGLAPGRDKGAGGRLPRQVLLHRHPRAGDSWGTGRIGAPQRRGGHARQFQDPGQAPGNHPRRRPQRSDVRGLPAILRRNP